MKKLKNGLFLILYYGIIILSISIGSCKNSNDDFNHKKVKIPDRYKKGQIVYLKPDSVKVVVVSRSTCGCDNRAYSVYYFNKEQDKVNLTVDEELIY